MKTKFKLFGIFVAAALVLLGTPLFAASAGGAKDKHSDVTYGQQGGYLERKVRHELLLLPYYSVFDNLEFRVDGDTVILSGQVVQPVLKSDAGRTVQHVEGVRQVINNIQVLPLSSFDDRIRIATFRAIYGDPAMTKYAIQPIKPIRIIVDNGHVTLVGVVASDFDRNIAYLQANRVPDVFSVTNDLRVQG